MEHNKCFEASSRYSRQGIQVRAVEFCEKHTDGDPLYLHGEIGTCVPLVWIVWITLARVLDFECVYRPNWSTSKFTYKGLVNTFFNMPEDP
jgi:hypothetical protein